MLELNFSIAAEELSWVILLWGLLKRIFIQSWFVVGVRVGYYELCLP
jgi:hypothetical protein